ncbi:IS5 family transposase [Laribacter hongkongensis]|uniref:IS5 family transposase n=2 Tax=Laribacter hongkongensis TaxID=168471 RepID=UPI001EFDBDD3|nr:IS5 family transposase [Laribacter hongkongensis]MCG9030874.1 IS5 family transposase [Laribacter hongkongensis]MCG9091366.1 IS5 family transposase [Laribacter hongkongensis]
MRSLFAAEERENKLSRLGDPLESLGRHVDFAALAASVDRALPRPHRYFGGRPPYPTELMIRLLVIQQLFNLSDAQLEFQVLDRASFQRFLGIRDSGKVPDRNTVWAFRERLVQAGLGASLFDEVNRQLQAEGYLARCGQIIDATLVPVPTQRNGRTENAQIKQGETPEDWSAKKRAHKDVDASWTGKHGKQTFGYKLSVSTDCRYKLIRTVHVSPANEGDQTHLLKVLDRNNTSRDLYADRGYTTLEVLKADGWRQHIQRRAKPKQALSKTQTGRNRRISRIRARGEHPFAGLRALGGKFLRCVGLLRANLQLHLKVLTYNLKRLCWLKNNGVAVF